MTYAKVSRRAARGRERASTRRSARDRSVRNAAARRGSRVMLFELLEGRVERTKGMTEETVVGLGRCGRRRVGADVSGRSRRARPAIGLHATSSSRRHAAARWCRHPGWRAAGAQRRHAGSTTRPRNIQIQLNDRTVLRQALADWQIGSWQIRVRQSEIAVISRQSSSACIGPRPKTRVTRYERLQTRDCANSRLSIAERRYDENLDSPPVRLVVVYARSQRPGMHARDERVRALHRFPIDVKQHRLARPNRHLAHAVGVDAALPIDAPQEERRNPHRRCR